MALADPTFQASSSSNREEVTISRAEFYEFCCNRQHVVRQLLECLGVSEVMKDENQNIAEAVIVAEEKALLESAPSGGDQWMANPAWKQTAKNMLPKNIQDIRSKPTTVLELEWVHGYRGYDCRNNLKYLDDGAKAFGYHAAALSISYVKGQDSDKKQVFSVSIVMILSHMPYAFPILTLLTVELHSSQQARLGRSQPSTFTPGLQRHKYSVLVTSMRGYHKNGVCQMAFLRMASVSLP